MAENDRLPLDSPRWAQLWTRMGPGAEWISESLARLTTDPTQSASFEEVWPEICSEVTTYDAAYASAPHFLGIAESVPAKDSIDYLIVLGQIDTYAAEVPDDLVASGRQTIHGALNLALRNLPDCPTDHDLRYLLAAIAAFRGRRDLADVLGNFDAVQEPCPSCGTVVFPGDLQQVIDRDQERPATYTRCALSTATTGVIG